MESTATLGILLGNRCFRPETSGASVRQRGSRLHYCGYERHVQGREKNMVSTEDMINVLRTVNWLCIRHTEHPIR